MFDLMTCKTNNFLYRSDFQVCLSLFSPLIGYNNRNLTNGNELELLVNDDKLVLEQKLIEADQYLTNIYEGVVHVIGE